MRGKEYIASTKACVPKESFSTAILYVREMEHMPQTSLLRLLLKPLLLAAIYWRASGRAPAFEFAALARELEAAGWSGSISHLQVPGSWRELSFGEPSEASDAHLGVRGTQRQVPKQGSLSVREAAMSVADLQRQVADKEEELLQLKGRLQEAQNQQKRVESALREEGQLAPKPEQSKSRYGHDASESPASGSISLPRRAATARSCSPSVLQPQSCSPSATQSTLSPQYSRSPMSPQSQYSRSPQSPQSQRSHQQQLPACQRSHFCSPPSARQRLIAETSPSSVSSIVRFDTSMSVPTPTALARSQTPLVQTRSMHTSLNRSNAQAALSPTAQCRPPHTGPSAGSGSRTARMLSYPAGMASLPGGLSTSVVLKAQFPSTSPSFHCR